MHFSTQRLKAEPWQAAGRVIIPQDSHYDWISFQGAGHRPRDN